MADDRIEIEIVLDDGSIQKGFANVRREGRRAAEDLNEGFARPFSRSLKALGTQLAAVFAIGGIGIAIRNFAEFEQSLVSVGKTTDLTDDQLQGLGKSIKQLASDIPVSTNDLLDLATVVGQFGVRGSENILAFTETLAKLQVATDLAGQEGAQSLARILNITRESSSEIKTLGSVVTALGNNFEAFESQIVDTTTQIARGIGQFGATSAEASALGATLQSLGVQSETAGTQIQKVFQELDKAVIENGRSVRRFADVAGVEVEKFRKLFQEDAFEAFRLFTKGLRDLDPTGKTLNATLRELGFNNERLFKVIPALTLNFDKFQKALNIANAEVKEATALDREASKAFNTLGSDLTRLGTAIANVGNTIVQLFSPALRAAINLTTEFLNKLSGISTIKPEERLANLQKRLSELNAELVESEKAGFFSFSRATAQIQADIFNTERAIESLKDQIGTLSSVEGDSGALDRLGAKAGEVATTIPIVFDSLGSTFVGFGNLLGETFSQFSQKIDETVTFTAEQSEALAKTINTVLVNGISQGIQATISAIVAGKNAFEALGKSILNLVGDLAISLGQFVLGVGISKVALESLPGGATIAAGLGLIALGSLLKALGSSGFVAGDASAGGGVSLPSPDTLTDIDEDEEIEQLPTTQVAVNIQGDVFDSADTGLRIVDIINQSFDTEGTVIATA